MEKTTKQEIVEYISRTTGINNNSADKAVTALTDFILENISKKQIMLPKIGKLYTVHRSARQGTNPSTGQPMMIPEHDSVKFSVSATLKKKVANAE